MQRLFAIFVLAVSLAASASFAFAGEVIDGIVVTVSRKPILRSEWDETVRFEAFMQQKRLADISQSQRVAALQRLIDRELLNAQMMDANELRPSDHEVSEDIAKLRAQLPGADRDASWQALLAQYRLTQTAIAKHLKDEVRVMNFIDLQLRPNIHIQDSEVQAYYRDHFATDSSSREPAAALKQVAPKIHELLVQQRMDEMLDAWLHNLRQQTQIQSLVPLPAVEAAGASQVGDGQ
jgi:hypothetical protein